MSVSPFNDEEPRSFPAIGSIVIRRDGEQSDEIPVTVRSRTACLGDAQRVDRIDALGGPETADLLPLQALVAVQLVPGQLANFVEGIQSGVALNLLQREQVVLKHRIVQVKPDLGITVRHGPGA